MYRIKGSVYYELYGEQVYARNVAARRDYLLNEITYDILNGLSKNEFRAADAVISSLLEEYEIEDDAEFQEEIADFLKELAAQDILETENSDEGVLKDQEAALAAARGEYAAEKALPDQVEDQAGDAAGELRKHSEDEITEALRQYCENHGILAQLSLELTWRCNEKCMHCYVDGPTEQGQELTLEEYKAILKEARNAGCLSVLLTGGEVCMRPDWIEIAEYAASIGMLVDIYSNGIAITDELFERICALHPNSLSFSLYAGTPAVHDAITQVPGSFARTLKSVEMTARAGIDTYIKTVVIKENADDLENLFLLGEQLKVPVTPALTVFDSHAGIPKSSHMLDSAEEYLEVIDLCRRYAPNVISRGSRDLDDTACSAGAHALNVNPYGGVYACIGLEPALGNIRDKNILEIWKQSKELKRIRCTRCVDLCPDSPKCRYADYCHFCMAKLNPETGRLPKETCIVAEASWLSVHRGAGG